MPDTGAPHFIPFADPTDLVRDWPALSEDVAEAVADGLDEAGNAGIGSNVVQTVKTDVFSSTDDSFTTVTGLTATITPSSDTAKVLIVAQVVLSTSIGNGDSAHLRLAGGNTSTYVGDADAPRTRAVSGLNNFTTAPSYGRQWSAEAETLVFLDEPADDTPVTYSVEMLVGAGTGFVNRSGWDGASTAATRGASSITLIEVAA